MLRVLCVIDDYNELLFLERLLRKIGFDVDGLQNPRKFSDVCLGFNPQVIIVTMLGKTVNGISLSQKVNKRGDGFPYIIALQDPHQGYSMDELSDTGIDELIETPINVKKLLKVLSEVGSVDFDTLVDKLAKAQAAIASNQNTDNVESKDPSGRESNQKQPIDYYEQSLSEMSDKDQLSVVKGNNSVGSDDARVKRLLALGKDADAVEKRKKRNSEYLSKMAMPDKELNFDPDVIKNANRRIRLQRDEAEEMNADLDKSRQDFVKALFTKED